MADVTPFMEMMTPMQKGEGKLEPHTWDDEKYPVSQACLGVLEQPAENVAAIIAKFADVDDGRDFKARFLLRQVVTVAGKPEQKNKLEAVVGAIAAALTGDRNKEVKAALIRELKFCGTASAAKAMAPFVTDDQLYADACMALRNIKEGATALLVAALPAATGKARTEIVHSLAALGEAPALAALQGAIADKEPDTRIEACWGLARLADASSADAMLAASDAATGWERIQITNALMLLGESLTAAGKKADAAKVYTALRDSRKDPKEAYIVELAKRALAV
jgi:hypothetical protein